jgi:hypothetical protein
MCGPAGEKPPVAIGLEIPQVEQLCREALRAPDRHVAQRLVREGLSALETTIPGVRNEGFLATHVLERAGDLPEAKRAGERAMAIRGLENVGLLEGLGFRVERHDNQTSILEAADRRRAVAVLLDPGEAPEAELLRFSGLSPVSYGLEVADQMNLEWVLLLQGERIRIYPVRTGVGVAQRGRTETFVEVHSGLLAAANSALLWLIFSAEALVDAGTLGRLLDQSRRFAGDLAKSLRGRVYNVVIPRLAESIAVNRGLKRPSVEQLAETYEMAMLILFRLLFIAYAEDKDLLPYRRNEAYQKRSVKSLAADLQELHQQKKEFDTGSSMWGDVRSLFRAVDRGQREWAVPAYGGSLFSIDPSVSTLGAELEQITLMNPDFGEVLSGLLLTDTPEGLGPVDFRSLGVREFGTIYEGLLESELTVASGPLVEEDDGALRPAERGERADIARGEIYLHNRSGLRKASGSYYTQTFAVEHLLENALEPALREHLDRLRKLDETEAAERFFDFRVADIAMGSGHFLVAAIDRIEKRLGDELQRRSLPRVREELEKLRRSAREALGELADEIPIEDSQLLRRLIARRCIYGVDINPIAVDLARVSIWIHTFVPGLPLTLLDRNLIRGNSLVGIGQVAEIEELESEGRGGKLLASYVPELLSEALEPIRRLGKATDANAAEVERARRAMAEAEDKVDAVAKFFDIATAGRLEEKLLPVILDRWHEKASVLAESAEYGKARKSLEGLSPFHFPVRFPEVFLRPRAGFDVIVGNPPWDEATIEEHAFWARHEPGLRGLSQREQERRKAELRRERPDLVVRYEQEVAQMSALREALTTGPYPGMGTGDPDLYKAFCWRFWQLVAADGGRIGVVLPRSALAARGSEEFRKVVFSAAADLDITMLLNKGQWVFPEVHPQYTIGLVAITRRDSTA